MTGPSNASRVRDCLRELGVEPKIDSFSQRKTLQKLVYLVEVFNVDLGFSYSWYLHGPYSPGLTSVLYDNTNSFAASGDEPAIDNEERERVRNLKLFLGDDIGSPDTLELLVSMHYLLVAQRNSSRGESDALAVLKKLKPGFSEGEIHRAYDKVKTILQ